MILAEVNIPDEPPQSNPKVRETHPKFEVLNNDVNRGCPRIVLKKNLPLKVLLLAILSQESLVTKNEGLYIAVGCITKFSFGCDSRNAAERIQRKILSKS